MRIDVKKFVFMGLAEDKSAFFEEAQTLGIIQFKEAPNLPKDVNNAEIQVYTDAIRALRAVPPLKQEKGVAFDVANQVIQLKQTSEKIEEEIRLTKLDIERIAIFGNFSLDDISYLQTSGKLFIQFFCTKHGEINSPDLIYIDSNHGMDYFVSIASTPASYPGLIELKIDRSLAEQKEALNSLLIKKAALEKSMHQMAVYNHQLHQGLVEALNKANLNRAEIGAIEPLDSLFCATGFVPEDKIHKLADLGVYASEIAVSPDDVVPTYLENENLSKIGEDVIGIYDTPSTQDKDPSLWVLLGFIVFFSIIIGDGGYGSVYLGLALFIRYKYPLLHGVKKRMLNLATYLSVGCVIWGILSSSFFGMNVNPENPVRSFSVVHYLASKKAAYHKDLNTKVFETWVYKYPEITHETAHSEILEKGYIETAGAKAYELLAGLTDEVLMEIALFIGVAHLIFGMLRYVKKNPGNIGWVVFLIGSYLYFPVFLDAPSLLNYVFHVPYALGGEIGLQMIFGGIAWAVGFSVFRNGLIGFTEIMTLIQVFGDVLSYLRLYALGLSGSILSNTINSMSSHMPFVLAAVLIIFGHIVNMLLGIMGGVIHGLRLNFLEWYHYSFEGGGRKFKPLKINELE
jgi:V/A-type H+-transporting ATPase subunit I